MSSWVCGRAVVSVWGHAHGVALGLGLLLLCHHHRDPAWVPAPYCRQIPVLPFYGHRQAAGPPAAPTLLAPVLLSQNEAVYFRAVHSGRHHGRHSGNKGLVREEEEARGCCTALAGGDKTSQQTVSFECFPSEK